MVDVGSSGARPTAGALWIVFVGVTLAVGCGPSAGTDGDGSGSSEGSGTAATGPTTAMPTTAPMPADSTGEPGTTGGGTTGASTTMVADSGTTGTPGSTGGDSSTGAPIECDPPDAVAALPFVWVSNATEGTVSKINTQTATEVGRYVVRSDGAGSPSRTSVSFAGNMAVANRSGGVTMVFANEEDCVDTSGDGTIQTSTDSTALAWGTEECIAWSTPLDYFSNRPVAWTPGVFNEEACAFEGSNVWTSGANGSGTEVLLLDGETGAVLQTVAVPQVVSGIGLYGGAVDGNGDFWGIEAATSLVRVRLEDFGVDYWPFPSEGTTPGYGITVDNSGRPLLCAGGHVARFTPATEVWDVMPGAIGGIGGCATDGQGTLWHGRYPDGAIVGIDTETLTVVDELEIPAYVHGVSVDFEGNVWGVTFAGTDVYRVDPSNGDVEIVTGLNGLYTYSDMTGLALASVSGLL